MTLDPVDLDLQIEKLKTDIAQADVKIKQAKDGLQNQSEKISNSEKQGQLDIQAAQAESLLNQGTCGGYCKTKSWLLKQHSNRWTQL